MPRTFWPVYLTVALSTAACVGRTNVTGMGVLPDTTLAGMMAVANGFWRAAAAGDSATMGSLSSDPKPTAWARRISSAYPSFFDTTKDQLAVRHAYFVNQSKDTAIVQLEVPWISCPPPAHSGIRDQYFVMLTPLGEGWRLINIWSDPC